MSTAGDAVAAGAVAPDSRSLALESDLTGRHDGDTAVFVPGQAMGPVRVQPGVVILGEEVAVGDEIEVFSVAGSGPHYLDQESPIGVLRFTSTPAAASDQIESGGYCGQEMQYCYWINDGYCQKCLYGVTCYGWYGDETWCW